MLNVFNDLHVELGHISEIFIRATEKGINLNWPVHISHGETVFGKPMECSKIDKNFIDITSLSKWVLPLKILFSNNRRQQSFFELSLKKNLDSNANN